jgi:hypothetical protein
VSSELQLPLKSVIKSIQNDNKVISDDDSMANETSSIPDEELHKILTTDIQHEFKNLSEDVGFNPLDAKHLINLLQPSSEAIGRARCDANYVKYKEKFEGKYGRTAYDPIEIERVSKKLDSNFKILQDDNKGVERKDFDLMLY